MCVSSLSISLEIDNIMHIWNWFENNYINKNESLNLISRHENYINDKILRVIKLTTCKCEIELGCILNLRDEMWNDLKKEIEKQ